MKRHKIIKFIFGYVLVLVWLRPFAYAQELSVERYSMPAMLAKDWQPQEIKILAVVKQAKLYTSYRLEFLVDGLRQYALLAIPRELREAELSLILLLHGYIPPEAYSTERSYSGVFARYASSEFAVLKPDYRGHDRSEGRSEVTRNRFFYNLFYTYDIRQLIASLYAAPLEVPAKTHSTVSFDEDKLFIMGHSMGGQISLRLLEFYPKVRAASLWAPVSIPLEQSAQYFWNYPYSYGTHSAEEARKFIRAAALRYGIQDLSRIRYSEVGQLRTIKTPLRIHHPASDEVVPVSQTLELLPKLREAKVAVEYFDYPNDNHNIARNQAKVQQSDLQWFRSYLK